MLKREIVGFAGAASGVALALFLVFLQSGFYFGFKRDITVVQDSFNADVWIAPRALLSFDYAVHLDDAAYWQARSASGVASAARVVFDWSKWRIPLLGGKESVQILGLDLDTGIRFDFGAAHTDAGAILRREGHVFVDQKEAGKLGISRVGQEAEINGRWAKVAGFVAGKKLFSTSCLVVTDLDNARRFLDLPPQRISFVAVKCRPDADVGRVAAELRRTLPEHDVFTAHALHNLTQRYWESRTGIGPILFLSAGLAALVGFLTVLLTFYLLTVQKLPVFAALKALGASATEIAAVIAIQASILFVTGCAIAGVAVALSLAALSRTSISVVITPGTALAVMGLIALASALACVPAFWKIIRLEPAEAFRT